MGRTRLEVFESLYYRPEKVRFHAPHLHPHAIQDESVRRWRGQPLPGMLM